MPLTVDWSAFENAGSEVGGRYRYPQPIPGFICSRCLSKMGKRSHSCIELTCSCECPELGEKLDANVVPEEEFDGNPFHGRRRDVDANGFLRMALPRSYGHQYAHKMHKIKRTAWAHKSPSVNPYLWRLSLQMHDYLLRMAFTRPENWREVEIREIWDADKELQREINWRHAEANRIAKEFKIPLYQSGQKWHVLRALIAEPTDSHVLAAATGLPQKHVSSWLSTLEKQGFVRRIGWDRLNKAGRENIIWEACIDEVLKLPDQEQTDVG